MAAFSYEEAVKMVNEPEKLELEIDSMHNGVARHLNLIGRELKDWRGMAPALNLKEHVVGNIQDICTMSPRPKGPELLREWKKETLNPTYSKLMKACVENGDAGAVRKIAELLNDKPPQPLAVERLRRGEYSTSTSKLTESRTSSPRSSPELVQPIQLPERIANILRKKRSSLKVNRWDMEQQRSSPVPMEEPIDACKAPKPIDCPVEDSMEYLALTVFSDQVEIILQTVLEPEYFAALSRMQPHSPEYDNLVSFKGHVIGMFANCKTALIKSESGMDVRDGVTDALEHFKDAKYILSVGVCYPLEEKMKKGDVIVSKKITRGKIQLKHENCVDNNGDLVRIVDDLKKIFCKNISFDYEVSNMNRKSKVYKGHVLSFPAFVDSFAFRDKLKKAVPGAIAGEKEGSTLLKIQEERTNQIEGTILIKGVVDFEDKISGSKEDWQYTSSRAALKYAEEKLEAWKNETSTNLIDYQPLNTDFMRRRNADEQPKVVFNEDSTTNAEEPIFDAAKQEKEYKKRMPAPPPPRKGAEDDKTLMLLEFTKQIHIILLTVHQCEYQAAVTEMRPPNNFFEQPVKFPTNGIIIGMLGFNQVALIKVGVGMAAADCLKDAVEKLPYAKFVIAVGGCYGFDRDVLQRGDIVVSNAIISQNSNVEVEETMLKLFTNKAQLFNSYSVSNTGRFSRVYEGKYDLCHVNGNRSEVGEAIGGEISMEGGVESYLMHQKEIVGVIVIKGVIGYDENSKMMNWLFTATRAALSFAKQNLNHYDSDAVDSKYPNPHGRALSDVDVKDLVESGLGYGVDATEPNPRNERHMCIRELVSGTGKNYERQINMDRAYDEWNAFDKFFFDATVKAEINPNPDPVKVFGGEHSSSSVTKYKSAIGYKRITRHVEFNPDLTETEKNGLINEMCKELHRKYPRISSSSPAAIENYFSLNQEKMDDFVGCVYKFIEEKKVTHYISALALGACEYYKSTRQRFGAAPLNSVTQNQGLMARIRGAFARNAEHCTIGENIDTVAIGVGEGVIEYELLPIYSLIQRRHAHFREVVSKAIIFYLEKESGPYWLQCGSNGSYVKCVSDRLLRVKSKEEASQFRIFETNDYKYFSIGHRVSADRDYSYVTSESTLSQEVILARYGSRAFFSLNHAIRSRESLSIAMWKTTFCSIQIKQVNFRRSYLGWRERDGILSMKKEDRSESFKLIQVPVHSPVSKVHIVINKPEEIKAKVRTATNPLAVSAEIH